MRQYIWPLTVVEIKSGVNRHNTKTIPLFSLLISSGCFTGRYGVNCESHCNTYINKICNRQDGHCIYGCIEGFKGNGCHLLGIHTYIPILTPITATLICFKSFQLK